MSTLSTTIARSTKGTGRGGNKHHSDSGRSSSASVFVSRALIPIFVALAIFCAAAAVITIIARRRASAVQLRRRGGDHQDNRGIEEQVGPGVTIKDGPKLWDLWTKVIIAGEEEEMKQALTDHNQKKTEGGWKSTMVSGLSIGMLGLTAQTCIPAYFHGAPE